MGETPIVITGPGGWIGSAFLAGLAARDGPGWERRVRLFGSSARSLSAPDGTRLPVRPLGEIGPADVDGAQVIHLAYLTKEKVAALGERAFFETNAAIDEAVERAARAGAPAGLFVASSGAAALAADGRDRHLYGVCKLLQEDRFLRFGAETAVPVLAGRIWNLAGPFINKLESYAISAFILQARRSGEIRIEARTPVYRAYLHVADLVTLVLKALGEGEGAARPLDLTGPLVVEMQDVAEAVARATGLLSGSIRRAPLSFASASRYLGDPTDTRSFALRFGHNLADFQRQVDDTIAFIGVGELESLSYR